MEPTPITYLSSTSPAGAGPSANSGRRTRSLAGTRTWTLAAEVMEIMAHVSPVRKMLCRFLGPRGVDLLFFGTGLAGMLLPLIASENIDGFALLTIATRFALGFLIEPWWIDLLFGIAGITMFLYERHQHRRARLVG